MQSAKLFSPDANSGDKRIGTIYLVRYFTSCSCATTVLKRVKFFGRTAEKYHYPIYCCDDAICMRLAH